MLDILYHGPYKYPDSYSINARNLLFALEKRGFKIRNLGAYKCPYWEHQPSYIEGELVDAVQRWEAFKSKAKDYVFFQHCIPDNFAYDENAVSNIGYTMFETDKLPSYWGMPMMAMDRIAVPTKWCRDVFLKTGLKKQQIDIIPIGHDPELFKPNGEKLDIPDLEDKIVFGCAFDWTPRKNGEQLIAAFLSAFSGRDDVVLIAQVYSRGNRDDVRNYFNNKVKQLREGVKCGSMPQIIISENILPHQHMPKFYNTIDWFLSPSHGEGFNMPVLEAMACGVPSIVTMWSGHMDFCNIENSLPILDSPLGAISEEQIRSCGRAYQGANWAMPSYDGMICNMQYASSVSQEDYAELSSNGIETAKNYTWDIAAEWAERIICESIK